MRIRLKKVELAVVALTLAFACFIGGYFLGRRGAVNIVTFVPQQNAPQSAWANEPARIGDGAADQASAAGDSGAAPDAGAGAGTGAAASADPAAGPGAAAREQPQEAVGAPRDSDGKININTASRSELMDLSGIGEVIAGRIIDYRNSNGPFSRIEDIVKVSGIGEKKFDAIKDKITVG